MQKLNLTLTKRVALLWLKNIDRSLVIFKLLRDYFFPVRLLFYSGLIGFTIFGLVFASSFINFDDAPGAPIWQLLGNIIFYGVIIGMFFIVTLESLYKLDVVQILADIKEQKAEIKAKKLQKWRLRNMSIFLRIFIYLSLYMFCLFIIQTSAQGAFIDIFGTAPDNAETQAQIAIFVNEYDVFVKWFTFIYIIAGLTLDYFVSKKRAQRRIEVQNETL